ncbi:hypothetical protein H2204_015281 [Knufia peltigerae]|uniref:Xylanolytic transcriptional activator regulatory domain-containing protein n=1 Tax=Knufia peltigerae TaxID=1002370 RepID=A0AA39CJ84_9EURO|nr:hypothetical protein H2204_015281 [Knufia peltigerae]
MNNQANFRALQDRLLDQFDVEQLQRALQRRRPGSQVLSQSCVDPATELPVSPGVTGFTAARNWPDVSAGVVSECSAAPSIDVDADLAFWTTLAGWDGPELNLPPMPSGRMLPLLRILLDRTLLTRYDLAFPTGPLQQPLPIPTFVNNGAADAYDFHVPTEVVHELIDLFFDSVQCFLPLFHRPRFVHRFKTLIDEGSGYSDLKKEDAFILSGVMAMSARFSTSSFFDDVAPYARGQVFAAKARALYDTAFSYEGRWQPSMALLQGCILLSFHEQTSRPSTNCWFLIGSAVRLALELGLNNIDAERDESQLTSRPADEWVLIEEQRRAWWAVWELDVFSSTILRRPYCIDKEHMCVLLPIPDPEWFADTPVPSTMINTDSARIWDTLHEHLHLGARAWFLISTFLMARANDFLLHTDTSLENIDTFEATLPLFMLLLPPEYDLRPTGFLFNERNFASYNWIISMNVMLHTVRVLLRKAREARRQPRNKQPTDDMVEEPIRCPFDTQTVFRAMQAWAPEYIAQACPFITCTIVGPSLDMIRTALHADKASDHDHHIQLIKLVLRRIGRYWDIGNCALRLVEISERESDLAGQGCESELSGLRKSFSLLVGSSRLQAPFSENPSSGEG